MPTSTYEHIASFAATGTDNAISISSIPQTYTDLKIIFNGIKAGANLIPQFRFNSNTSSIYNGITLSTSTSLVGCDYSAVGTKFYLIPSGVDQANTVTLEIDVMGYTSTTKAKSVLLNYQGRLVTAGTKALAVGLFNSTAAITSVTFSDVFGSGFTTNTNIQVYGIKAA
jgi:hypothetical protein